VTIYRGVEEALLHVTGHITVSGIAAGGAVVENGGILHASGVISGPLRITRGGTVAASGVISGEVEVGAGGRVDLTGVLSGQVLQNDGDFTAAVGSIIHGRRVSAEGAFAATSASESVYITSETRRFHLVGTGAELSISESR